MINIYKTNVKTGLIDSIEKPVKGCWINLVKPTDKEISDIAKLVNIEEHLLKYPLDIAEKAHIDFEDDAVLIVVDSPATEYKKKKKYYTTLPLGMILVRDDIFITISQVNITSVDQILNNSKPYLVETQKKSRFVFKGSKIQFGYCSCSRRSLVR